MTAPRRTRILFGGSFDPPTHAHIDMGAKLAARFDEVIVLPARLSPFKQSVTPAPGAFRLALLTEAFAAHPNITVSDFELNADGVSYSYLSAREFSSAGVDLYFAVGSDALDGLKQWAHADELKQTVRFYVVPRPGFPLGDWLDDLRAEGFSIEEADFTGKDGASSLYRVAAAFNRENEISPDFVVAAARQAGYYNDYRYITEKYAAYGLSANRIEHCYRTAMLSVQLASRFGADKNKAARAGLLHDIGKNTDEEAVASGADLARIRCSSPPCRHAHVSAVIAARDFDETDADVLAAIETHTVGAPAMSVLQKVIFVADYIEPGRDFTGLDAIRAVAETDLDAAVYRVYKSTIDYLSRAGLSPDPKTFDGFNYYKVLCKYEN